MLKGQHKRRDSMTPGKLTIIKIFYSNILVVYLWRKFLWSFLWWGASFSIGVVNHSYKSTARHYCGPKMKKIDRHFYEDSFSNNFKIFSTKLSWRILSLCQRSDGLIFFSDQSIPYQRLGVLEIPLADHIFYTGSRMKVPILYICFLK